MAIKTIIFALFYVFALGGSVLYHPIIGIIGYIMTYIVAPATQWWADPLTNMGMRYSFFMAAALALGMITQAGKLKFPGKFYGQEILFCLFIVWIQFSSVIGLENFGSDNFAVKLFKVYIFLWMAIRIVDDKKKYEIFLWAIIITTFYVGYDTLGASTARFGRLDRGVGGSDFAEGNFLAAHFAMVLPYLGVMFLRGDTKHRILILLMGVLQVNGIVLCRSRGVFLALGMGVMLGLLWAPREWRRKIIPLIVVGLIGASFLVDEGYLRRIGRINTNIDNIEEQDDSASGRILAWRAALAMAADYPLGIGQGNFSFYVGRYQPDIPGKDTHNTYFRCLAELGIPGLFLMLAMIWNAFRMLKRQKAIVDNFSLSNDFLLYIYAQRLSLSIFLAAGMFITETYIEEFYWLLMMPILIERAVQRELIDSQADVVPV